MVESNPTLCVLFNGDVGTFMVLNFKNKFVSPMFLMWFTFEAFVLRFHT
jgi:hypothetical protein